MNLMAGSSAPLMGTFFLPVIVNHILKYGKIYGKIGPRVAKVIVVIHNI
jgi:hypothetical protein